MHKEYAIDPTILNSFDRIRSLLGTCSWATGKVVCEYPNKKWKKAVYKACANRGDIEKTKITEFLNTFYFCKRKSPQVSDQNTSWLDLVKEEHKQRPFSAILSDFSESENQIIDGQYLTEDDLYWARPAGISARTPTDFSNLVSLIAQNSRRFIFVDPYFSCHEPRFTAPLTAMLQVSTQDNYIRKDDQFTFELHMKKKETDPSSSQLKRGIETQLPQHVPVDLNIRIYIWQELDLPTERLHNRYFLTDLAGMSFGIGLDTPSTSNNEPVQNDDIFLLTKEQHQRNLSLYHASSTCFNLLEDFEITGTQAIN